MRREKKKKPQQSWQPLKANLTLKEFTVTRWKPLNHSHGSKFAFSSRLSRSQLKEELLVHWKVFLTRRWCQDWGTTEMWVTVGVVVFTYGLRREVLSEGELVPWPSFLWVSWAVLQILFLCYLKGWKFIKLDLISFPGLIWEARSRLVHVYVPTWTWMFAKD